MERGATKEQQSSLHRPSGLVGTMAEEPMIASSNAEASKEVPNDSNHKRLPPQVSRQEAIEGERWCQDQQDSVKPVDLRSKCEQQKEREIPSKIKKKATINENVDTRSLEVADEVKRSGWRARDRRSSDLAARVR